MSQKRTPLKVLITGAGGMLGSYLSEEFREEEIFTLGLREGGDYRCDLTKGNPDFGQESFHLVVHTAGTENEKEAMALNLEGTKHLCTALEKNPPACFVYLSSHRVYSRDAGENITEKENTWASDNVGKSKALAESFLRDWCEARGIVLTIIRPARMFGNGVKGDTLQLFNDAIAGKYIHIRGNDAKVSMVCALDVARGIKEIYEIGGIYNASDGHDVRFIDMVESMSANAGYKKRMTHLPANWAEWLWRLGRWMPSIERNLAPDVVQMRMKSFTLDGSLLAETAGIDYHDTIEVMEHRHPSYPYTSMAPKLKAAQIEA